MDRRGFLEWLGAAAAGVAAAPALAADGRLRQALGSGPAVATIDLGTDGVIANAELHGVRVRHHGGGGRILNSRLYRADLPPAGRDAPMIEVNGDQALLSGLYLDGASGHGAGLQIHGGVQLTGAGPGSKVTIG